VSEVSVIVHPDPDALALAASEMFIEAAAQNLSQRSVFTVALAGGSTPRRTYSRLASPGVRSRVEWSRVHIFFGDERCVPPDNPASNYRMAAEGLLDSVPLPAGNVHRWRAEGDPELAAAAYELELRRVFRTAEPPRFDLLILGLGENGHTASLYPGTAVLREQRRWTAAQYVEVLETWRLTLTLPVINAARLVLFLVEGAGKAATLGRVLAGPYEPDVLPAQLVQPGARVYWLVDSAAAAQLPGPPRSP
jgi:6-phosphogluconolactonase